MHVKKRSQYSAILLRYVHDVMSGEFVNVGLFFVCPDRNFAKFRELSRAGRITDFFPGVRAHAIRSVLRTLSTRAMDLSLSAPHIVGQATSQHDGMLQVAHRLVPKDNSGLQWSEPFSGLTSDAAETFERLMDRLVLKYQDRTPVVRRTDDQVWRTFSKALEKRNLRLQEHEIKAKLKRVTFKHALKNSQWHLMEPVSFDLATVESITEKAEKLLGQMTLLSASTSHFKTYFLVGKPSSDEVCEGYERALQILEQIPGDHAIYQESQAEQFANDLERVATAPH